MDAFSYDYSFPWTKEMDDNADPHSTILVSNDKLSFLAKTYAEEYSKLTISLLLTAT